MDENFEARLGSLSPAKLALLEKIKAAKVQASAAEQELFDVIARRNDPTSPAPLSFAQQRLWFLAQLDGLDATYNMPSAIELLGPLNVTVLKNVFSEICHRHEALRTNFQTIDGQAFQIIRPSRETDIAVVNLEDLTPNKQQEEYERLALAVCHAPFDLEHDHLLRLKFGQVQSRTIYPADGRTPHRFRWLVKRQCPLKRNLRALRSVLTGCSFPALTPTHSVFRLCAMAKKIIRRPSVRGFSQILEE